MKTAIIIYAHGCNRADAEIGLLNDYLSKNGYHIVIRIEDADIVFVCTCGFDASSEIVSLNILSKTAKTISPNATLVAIGCLAGINKEGINERCGAKIITVPPKNMKSLDSIIGAKVTFQSILNDEYESLFYIIRDSFCKSNNGYLFTNIPDCINRKSRNTFTATDRLLAKFSTSKSLLEKIFCRIDELPRISGMRKKEFWLPGLLLSIGCPGECTYCAIRNAAGPLCSIPIQTVVKRFENIIEQNHKLIELVAADVGAYGHDKSYSIVDLLKRLFSFEKSYMLVISDFNPRWLVKYSDELISLLSKNQDRVDQIIFPIQSGSDKILSLMKRNVTSNEMKESINRLKYSAPNIPITTHVLVGFPGETSEDFDLTMKLLRDIEFNNVFAFSYSDRPGSQASKFPNKVSSLTKIRRLITLKKRFKTTQNNSQLSYSKKRNSQKYYNQELSL